VAWLNAYLGELANRGLTLGDADRILGTSAGSVLVTIVAAGHLDRFARLFRPVARSPALVGRLAPAAALKPSQQRALDLFERRGRRARDRPRDRRCRARGGDSGPQPPALKRVPDAPDLAVA
jgi:predicted acylesterase/phospholipase RssA